MINVSTTVLVGLLICIPFSLFAIGSFMVKPRLWLHSLPLDIQQMAGPKTEREKKQTKFLLIPYLIILPGCSMLSALILAYINDIDMTFMGTLLYLYGVWLVVHVWDFVVIDCGFILLVDPQHPPIPGTEGAKGYKDYRFHFHSLIKALYMSLIFVVPAAIIIAFIS